MVILNGDSGSAGASPSRNIFPCAIFCSEFLEAEVLKGLEASRGIEGQSEPE
jgi:hypothetical protein